MASSLSSFDLASLLKYEFRGVELIVQPHSHILVYVQFSKSNIAFFDSDFYNITCFFKKNNYITAKVFPVLLSPQLK